MEKLGSFSIFASLEALFEISLLVSIFNFQNFNIIISAATPIKKIFIIPIIKSLILILILILEFLNSIWFIKANKKFAKTSIRLWW